MFSSIPKLMAACMDYRKEHSSADAENTRSSHRVDFSFQSYIPVRFIHLCEIDSKLTCVHNADPGTGGWRVICLGRLI